MQSPQGDDASLHLLRNPRSEMSCTNLMPNSGVLASRKFFMRALSKDLKRSRVIEP
jgi:hypothetical protein